MSGRERDADDMNRSCDKSPYTKRVLLSQGRLPALHGFAGICLWLSCMAGCTQHGTAPPPASPAPSGGISLTRRFKAGGVARYRFMQTSDVKTSAGAAGAMTIVTTLGADLENRILSVTPDGNLAQVAVRLSNPRVQIHPSLGTVPSYPEHIDAEEMWYSSNHVGKLSVETAAANAQRATFFERALDPTTLCHAVVFPSTCIKVGDSWDCAVPRLYLLPEDAKVKATLIREKQFGGVDCWDVRLSGTVPVSNQIGPLMAYQGMPVPAGLTGVAKGTFFIDCDCYIEKSTGELARAEARVENDIDADIQVQGAAVSSSTKMNGSILIQRTDLKGVTFPVVGAVAHDKAHKAPGARGPDDRENAARVNTMIRAYTTYVTNNPQTTTVPKPASSIGSGSVSGSAVGFASDPEILQRGETLDLAARSLLRDL